ncbi:MAG: CHRD domain-containing protein [Comamonadaceae bacterium]|nr:CHRD domain-containing protein [Comamonadaceae bacterium]
MPRFAPLVLAACLAAPALPAQALLVSYAATLSGSAEAPPNASPGTGSALLTIDTVLHTMSLQVTFSGLLAGVTASHIHCCTTVAGSGTAGVATTTPTFPGFPGGVTAGSYDHLFDLLDAGSWNPSFVTAHGGTPAMAEADFLTGLAQGKAYLNIHTTQFPGGEIRGFLTAVTALPEPASLALAGMALAGLAATRRRRG